MSGFLLTLTIFLKLLLRKNLFHFVWHFISIAYRARRSGKPFSFMLVLSSYRPVFPSLPSFLLAGILTFFFR